MVSVWQMSTEFPNNLTLEKNGMLLKFVSVLDSKDKNLQNNENS